MHIIEKTQTFNILFTNTPIALSRSRLNIAHGNVYKKNQEVIQLKKLIN